MSQGVDAITAAVLGALQGVTEFLPVSSSGHVALGAAFFGIEDNSLALTILLHLGTLLATVLLLRHDVAALFQELFASLRSPSRFRTTEQGRTLIAIVLATLVTGVLGLTLRHTAEMFASNLHLVGWGFLISAAFLLGSRLANGADEEVGWVIAVLVGMAQGFAVLPGVSRSGVTIATAMLLGLQGPAAFRFSFLISLPAIAGAAILEASGPEGLGALGASAWVGGFTAFVTGYLALVILRRIVFVGRLWMFALYLVPLGLYLVLR